MYTASKPENPEDYRELQIDGKTFYKLKGDVQKVTRRRRYSDQFKDPLFIQKDINRKLRMMRQFRETHGDLESVIERWKECISECISILCNQYSIPPLEIFKAFPLKKWGFDIEDYGGCEEDFLPHSKD
ncbi:putative double-strand recombination repair-like protein [Encephalitozoon hellem]|uniref:Double-strand recombination repair-like protein n=1 Tax=Encephalitozoon hellem TaxID=27973 RepID=A0A9Q9CB74_ENCHE|nr:uncharacterized protein EHEL_091010 [Encephalitozoon hellem ATCC 50504]AFM98996.1 hypothetical protein EHEL_091010 [Encephalitozoon hellem ATCC 50504]KAG5858829.1 putative double-strand recombination repair-like protein [Encephalitozoon hellem]UTX44012.1 putative double-strand recombination repair-like protein [Encephalitozoon hellem]WEL39497.1 putative double-strand recombination repair-like protein [Encephalitozoon hellem]|eukprot:XP_003887977.1 hypothetical protein EHEL_091010 [Encephalitozoon hellem ATCC 50504]